MPKVKQYDHYGEAYGFKCPGCSNFHILPVTGSRAWQFNHDLDNPTFNPSILSRMGYGDRRPEDICHSFVKEGKIQFLTDCTHLLAGQTIDLPDL